MVFIQYNGMKPELSYNQSWMVGGPYAWTIGSVCEMDNMDAEQLLSYPGLDRDFSIVDEPAAVDVFNCYHCDKTFGSESGLKRHMTRMHK